MASGAEMSRREEEGEIGPQAKRQRLEDLAEMGGLRYGGGPIKEVPERSYKELLAEPLPRFALELPTETTSHRPGVPVEAVALAPVGPLTKRILGGLPDYKFRLVPSEQEAPLPLGSEDCGNAHGQKWVFDPINEILAQWPDSFFRRWGFQLRTLKSDVSESGTGSHTAGSASNVPDWRCRIVKPKEGTVKPQKDTVLSVEGKRYGVFLNDKVSDEVVRTGSLDLVEAFKTKTLSEDGRRALAQCCWYLIEDAVDVAILFTPVVFWVIRPVEPRDTNFFRVSEPITASAQGPSMKEVAFAMVFHQIAMARHRMEGVPPPDWLVEASKEPNAVPAAGGSDDDSESTGGLEVSDNTTEGDQLLSELDDTGPPVHGNSLVRVGRFKGLSVAVKIVSGDNDRWVIREVENESRSMEALKPLQGSVIPEKVFDGRVNGGRDRLLVTKYVEGDRLDKVPVTKRVADGARRALQEIHNKGYVHGDIMPRNIIVKKSGDCVFVDLGRARRIKKDSEKEDEMAKLDVWLP